MHKIFSNKKFAIKHIFYWYIFIQQVFKNVNLVEENVLIDYWCILLGESSSKKNLKVLFVKGGGDPCPLRLFTL